MKKIISICLAVSLLVVSFGTMAAFAAEGDALTDGYFNYTVLADGTLSITGLVTDNAETTDVVEGYTNFSGYETGNNGKENYTILTLPSTVSIEGTNYMVSAVGTGQLFRNDTSIKGVFIPKTITNLCGSAFRGMSELKVAEFEVDEVTGKAGITEIPAECFKGCSKLGYASSVQGLREGTANGRETITIPEGVTLIRQYAFESALTNDYSASKMVLPTTLKKILNIAKAGDFKRDFTVTIKSADLKGYSYDDRWATGFGGANAKFVVYSPWVYNWLTNNEEKLTAPNVNGNFDASQVTFVDSTITKTVEEGDYNYTLTTDIKMGEDGVPGATCAATVNGFGATVLAEDEEGQEIVDIPASVTDPANGAYQVTTIADGAFKGKDNVSKVYLPEGLTTIGKEAFRSIPKLSFCYIPSTVISIGNHAFRESPGMGSSEGCFVFAGTPTTWGKNIFTPKGDDKPGKRTFYIRDTAVKTALSDEENTNGILEDTRDFFVTWENEVYIPDCKEFIYTADASGSGAKAYAVTYEGKTLASIKTCDAGTVRKGLNLIHNLEVSADGEDIKLLIWNAELKPLAKIINIADVLNAQ